ncbi:MAG: SLBB domain-containing protein [Drouetiella hepatica Uher 2000/2452]|jgi:polysaccharide export outer membrane protein|uniref:SLBB domain-containing protein n=1 Tax=Drouetiella hepatica Uher 2000/2452 TaxID=904376 RepID=A0A951UL25_9CYAN|nr:SLBB domain-containing protein [Drouetiella hepatica Uher 2000/2452]
MPRIADWFIPPASLVGLTLLASVAASPVSGQTLPSQTLLSQSPSQPLPNPPRSAAYVQPETPYTLGAGDQISVTIFQVEQYSLASTDVLIDGTLNLPLVGKIPVAGLTLDQATAALSAAYAQFLRRPIVTLSLLTRRPIQIGIAGEVGNPGSYTIKQEATEFPTLTGLLKTAGGPTGIADVRRIQVRRPQQSGLEQVINVDLWEFIQTGDLRYDMTLRDGDRVYIPATNVNLAEAPIVAASSFAGQSDKPINIAIVGEVFRPGTYAVDGQTARTAQAGTTGETNDTGSSLPTVTRALQVAGGIKPLADIRRVQVRRLTRAGTEQTFEVNLWNLLQNGDLRQDAILQEGDTIMIPTAAQPSAAEANAIASASFSPDQIRVKVVGEVNAPGEVQIPPNTPLNQAILAAGGFNRRARSGSVELLRLNPDGTVSQQRIDIDFSQGINDAANPALRNNDVVVVRRNGLATVTDAVGDVLSPFNGVLSIFNIFRQF